MAKTDTMLRRRVLVVDDDVAIRQTVRDILEIEGYEVLTAASGDEGLALLKRAETTPHVIILDMMMPVVSGWQFLDFQRADPELCRIPVIVCSAFKESARSVKPYAFLEKPVRLQSLREAVKACCA